MKTWIIAIAMASLAGTVCASPGELEDSYAKLKDSVAKKDADAVKTEAAATLKLAQALITAPKPADAAEAKDWAARSNTGRKFPLIPSMRSPPQRRRPADPRQDRDADRHFAGPESEEPVSGRRGCAGLSGRAAAKVPGGSSAKQFDGTAKIVSGRPDKMVRADGIAEDMRAELLRRSWLMRIGWWGRPGQGNKKPGRHGGRRMGEDQE